VDLNKSFETHPSSESLLVVVVVVLVVRAPFNYIIQSIDSVKIALFGDIQNVDYQISIKAIGFVQKSILKMMFY
jgi:hypothetical protein